MTAPAGGGPPQVVIPGAGWVDLLSRVIVQVGFPVVVAGVLLWFLLTRFQDNMNMITSRMSGNTESVAALISAERTSLSELQTQTLLFKEQTAELKLQTEALSEQSQLMHKIADDSGRLVVIRQQELEMLKSRLGSGAGRQKGED